MRVCERDALASVAITLEGKWANVGARVDTHAMENIFAP